MDNKGPLSPNEGADRTIAEVMKSIISELQEIIRSEIRLAGIELGQAARGARSAAAMFAGTGILAIFAAGFLLLTGMFALELVLPAWLAALIVSVVLMIAAGIGYAVGKQRLARIRPPRDTVQTVKEDFQWIKEQQRS